MIGARFWVGHNTPWRRLVARCCPTVALAAKAEAVTRLHTEQRQQRTDVGENVVGRRHTWVEVDATPVDPAHRQAERLAADHVGELRLTEVQDVRYRDPRLRDQVSEQRAVRLVTAGSFGRAYQIKFPTKPSGPQEVVVDVRYDGQSVPAGQPFECRQ